MNAILAVSGGALLGFAFPPSPFYTLAYAAFIPFFLLLERLDTWGATVRWSYLFLLIVHLVTLSWTGGFTHMRDPWMMAAGGAVLIVHPLFYLPSILLARFVRWRHGLIWGTAAFVPLWVGFEYVHSLGELSFPWITIGNSQAYDLPRAQMIEYVSTLGLSALVLSFNAAAFLLLMKRASGEWGGRSRRALAALALLLILYAAPWLYGTWKMRQEESLRGPSLTVGILQPDVDPWEKWGSDRVGRWQSYDRQFQWHLDATRSMGQAKPDIVFWSETAVPFYLLDPRMDQYRTCLQSVIDSTGSALCTGLPTAKFFSGSEAPVTARPAGVPNLFVESYNSATLIQPGGATGPIYRKMILVPFAERIPYASALRFLIEPLRWNVGISSWGMGTDTVLFAFRARSGNTAQFAGMICYESAYPNFVRRFTERGAQFLVVLTNDSWWGNTPGAYQHAAFASLRAIENRRWVIQCANGGLSLVVHPSGRVVRSTGLYTQAQFTAAIECLDQLTPYVRWGDVFGAAMLIASAVIVLGAIIVPQKKSE